MAPVNLCVVGKVVRGAVVYGHGSSISPPKPLLSPSNVVYKNEVMADSRPGDLS